MTATRELRPSVRATYDSEKDGLQYHVTYRVDDRTVTFQQPIPDPFGRFTLHLSWRDLLRGLLRRKLAVTVLVGGDRERMYDVLELDEQQLIAGRTRHAAFHQHISERLQEA